MSDLSDLFSAQDKTKRWQAESENAHARLELARIEERCAYLISQHEPVAMLKIDREVLRAIFKYLRHGILDLLDQQVKGAI